MGKLTDKEQLQSNCSSNNCSLLCNCSLSKNNTNDLISTNDLETIDLDLLLSDIVQGSLTILKLLYNSWGVYIYFKTNYPIPLVISPKFWQFFGQNRLGEVTNDFLQNIYPWYYSQRDWKWRDSKEWLNVNHSIFYQSRKSVFFSLWKAIIIGFNCRYYFWCYLKFITDQTIRPIKKTICISINKINILP